MEFPVTSLIYVTHEMGWLYCIYLLFVSCVGPMFSSNDHMLNVAWVYLFIDTWNFLCTGLAAFSLSQVGSSWIYH